MPVGLYRDLAVGVAESRAETWHNPELYRLEAAVGAPPDRLGPLGQNWGLPPMDPHVMHARGYQPFIYMLRQYARLRRAAYRSRDGAAAAVVGAEG
nr:4-alpha-glucanotransferase [Candidatus Pantoea persica]